MSDFEKDLELFKTNPVGFLDRMREREAEERAKGLVDDDSWIDEAEARNAFED
jgi:hypothetical protein